MDDERKARVATLRENLRNGRNRAAGEASPAVDGTGETASSVSGVDGGAFGATVQDARGTLEHLTPTGGGPTKRDRRDRDNGRGTKREPRRVGRGNRRSEESNGGAAPDTATTERRASGRRSVGRLATDETIEEPREQLDLNPQASFTERQDNGAVPPTRYKEEYGRSHNFGRTPYYYLKSARKDKDSRITVDEYDTLPSAGDQGKQRKTAPITTAEEHPKLFKGGVLSQAEAEELYDPLVAALADSFGYIDKALWNICPQLDERPIWSNTTDKEDAAIAKLLLKRGQKSPGTAATVRGLVDSADYIMVGMAVVPRVHETVKALRERPASARKKRTLFRVVEP